MVNGVTLVPPTLLVAVISKVLATPATLYPVVLGVPDITPVEEFSVMPEGKLPLVTA
jgi:hypothetical protein